jgi:small subunit ribosomal protein S13
MVYILRTHIEKKKLVFGLVGVYGVGAFLSYRICNNLGFQKSFLVKTLTDEDVYLISLFVDNLNLLLKGDLSRWLQYRIDRLVSLNVYRGFRHRQGFPARGQRTHTNARTCKKLRIKKN